MKYLVISALAITTVSCFSKKPVEKDGNKEVIEKKLSTLKNDYKKKEDKNVIILKEKEDLTGEHVKKPLFELPAFPVVQGCEKATNEEARSCFYTQINRQIQKNIRMPIEGRDKKISERVIVSFFINEQGAIEEAKVVRGQFEPYKKEALRVINLIKVIKPAIQNGKPKKTKFNMPIRFTAH
jgi:TonB family protein